MLTSCIKHLPETPHTVKENVLTLDTKQLPSNWLVLNKNLITSAIWSICKNVLALFSSCFLEYFTLGYKTCSQACHKEMNQINSSAKYSLQQQRQQRCRDTICWLLYTNSVIECRCKTINHFSWHFQQVAIWSCLGGGCFFVCSQRK